MGVGNKNVLGAEAVEEWPGTEKKQSVSAEDRAFLDWVHQDSEGVTRATRALRGMLDQQGVRFGNERLPVSLRPYLLSEETEKKWGNAAEATLSAIQELGDLIAADDSLLAELGFDADARELLRIEGTVATAPMCARGDALWSDSSIQFVEFNTDSPAMFLFSDVLETAVVRVLSDLGFSFADECEPRRRTNSLINALQNEYKARGGMMDKPFVAVVDWSDVRTRDEQSHLIQMLESSGYPCCLCDPEELRYQEGRLRVGDRPIDFVYRRVLFPEFFERKAELEPLVRAVADGNVIMANQFRSFLYGNKAILALLWDESLQGRLSERAQQDVRRFIPESLLLRNAADRARVRDDREGWVLKPSFGSGGKEIAFGAMMNQSEWDVAVNSTENGVWIAQRSLPSPVFELPVASGRDWKMAPYWSNWNPWCFGGVYGGATVRCSLSPLVGISFKGALVASLSVPEK